MGNEEVRWCAIGWGQGKRRYLIAFHLAQNSLRVFCPYWWNSDQRRFVGGII